MNNVRKITIFYFVFFVGLSHFLLPVKDFFIFSRWAIFVGDEFEPVTDITWDNGKTFLIRDFRSEAKAAGVDVGPLFYQIEPVRSEEFVSKYSASLKAYCHCDRLQVMTLDISLFDHMFKRKEFKVTGSWDL